MLWQHADDCRELCECGTWDAGVACVGLGAGGGEAAAVVGGRAALGSAPAAGRGSHESDNWHVDVGVLTVVWAVTCGDGG